MSSLLSLSGADIAGKDKPLLTLHEGLRAQQPGHSSPPAFDSQLMWVLERGGEDGPDWV